MSLYKEDTMKHQTYPAEPFDGIIPSAERDNYSRMYKIHKYWARKPSYSFKV